MTIQCIVCFADNPDNTTSCLACGSPLNLDTNDSSSISSPLHLPPGTLIRQGHYKIEKTLGQGGFGITYKAMKVATSQELAIKELFPEGSYRQGINIIWSANITPKERQKEINDFKQEAAYLSQCIHPNITRVYDWFEENNTAYMVMDFIKGKSLLDLLKEEGPLPLQRAKRYFIQVAEALRVIHSHNLLHRDIKPENLLVNQQDQVVLIDFGSAREFLAEKSINHTQIITPGYAPLEQYSKRAKRGPSTDIYALCASMYEVLTGQLPPSATDRIPDESLNSPRQLVPQIDSLTEQVILTGMRIYARDRFQSADELIDALNGKFISPIQKQARELVSQGKFAEAIQIYDKCLNKEPNNGEAAVERALVQVHLNASATQAEKAAQYAIQIKPNDGRVYGILGLVNCRKKNWSEAVINLQKAANLLPQEVWIQANFAWALGKIGNWEQAKITVNKALQIDKECTFALGLQAWIGFQQQQYKLAIRSACQAVFKSKQNSSPNSKQLQQWVYPYLIVALDKAVTRQSNDVERRIEEFITQVPNSAFAWGFKGWKKAILGLWNQALPCFQQASYQPNAPGWMFINYGVTQEHLNNIQGAIQAYENYQAKLPHNSFIYFRLGTLVGQMGQWQQAKLYLEQAIQLKPDYAEAYHNLGWVLLNTRTPDGQLESFRELLSAYRQAEMFYIQQNKMSQAQVIKQAFQIAGVEL